MAWVGVRQLESQCFLDLMLISLLLPIVIATSTSFATSLPGCPDKCGNITIPYPFGTSPGCYRGGFSITCNKSTSPPKAFLGSEPASNIELLGINITGGEARVYKYIGYRCYNNQTKIGDHHDWAYMNLTRRQNYRFSNKRNKFTAIGCDILVFIVGEGKVSYTSGCVSYCENLNSTTGDGGSCNGLGCCQAAIPVGLNYYEVQWEYKKNLAWDYNPCQYAVLVEEDWFKFKVEDLIGKNFLMSTDNRRVPLVLDWAIRENGTSCQHGVEKSSRPACLSNYSNCYNTTNGEGYLCNCSQGYEGNPYIVGGCIDIDECKLPDIYRCKGICKNTEGSYECPCKSGAKGDGITTNCTEVFPYPARVAIYCITGVVSLLCICCLVVGYQHHKTRLKEKEEYQRYYQMMNNHLRVFSKKEIKSATKNFAETHVLGVGGQGKVYKGLLENNQIVAVKKAMELEERQRGEFVNEILLLSQINHRNIVRLLGCCLEDKTPMLVYEFVPNGTLFEFLHGNSNTISLGTRLQVALQSAEALDYLHSSISQTILHGDIKSANILLEADCSAKVSDFGASNLVPNDDAEVVKPIQGTLGYIEPDYATSGILTKKSDVYSFGIVLLELITRKCAIFTDINTSERKHLGSCFVSNANRNNLHDLLDNDIVTTDENVIEILQEVSELAVWCLSFKREDRPTMRQVVEKLQDLVRHHSSQLGHETIQEERQSLLSPSIYYTTIEPEEPR